MKKFTKYPQSQRAIKAAGDLGADSDKIIIRTPEDMDNFIFEGDIIDAVIEYAGDSDWVQKYNTPRSFARYAEKILKRDIEEYIEDSDEYILAPGVDAVDLISKRVLNMLREDAMSGDFS